MTKAGLALSGLASPRAKNGFKGTEEGGEQGVKSDITRPVTANKRKATNEITTASPLRGSLDYVAFSVGWGSRRQLLLYTRVE